MRVLSSIPDKYTCQKCRAKIPKQDLEDVYKQQLQSLILSPRAFSDYAKTVGKTLTEKQKQLDIAKKQLTEALAKSQKYLDLYVDDKLTKEAFGRYNAPLEEQKSNLEITVPELEFSIETLKASILHDSKLAYDSESLYQKWDSLTDEEKTRLIASLTDKILICGDKIEINLHFIPPVINSGHLGMDEPGTGKSMLANRLSGILAGHDRGRGPGGGRRALGKRTRTLRSANQAPAPGRMQRLKWAL